MVSKPTSSINPLHNIAINQCVERYQSEKADLMTDDKPAAQMTSALDKSGKIK